MTPDLTQAQRRALAWLTEEWKKPPWYFELLGASLPRMPFAECNSHGPFLWRLTPAGVALKLELGL